MFKIIKLLISMLRSLVRLFVSEDKPVEPNNRAKRRREYNDYRKRKAVELRKHGQKHGYRMPRDTRKYFAEVYAKETQGRDKNARYAM